MKSGDIYDNSLISQGRVNESNSPAQRLLPSIISVLSAENIGEGRLLLNETPQLSAAADQSRLLLDHKGSRLIPDDGLLLLKVLDLLPDRGQLELGRYRDGLQIETDVISRLMEIS